MKETFLNIRNQLARRLKRQDPQVPEDVTDDHPEYVELTQGTEEERKKSKIKVQQFVLGDFEDIKPILDALRKGSTIALVNIQPLKEKDIVELKRAINKLKKTCDAIDGDLAGFGDDYVVATPEFAYIHRVSQSSSPVDSSQAQSQKSDEEDFDV